MDLADTIYEDFNYIEAALWCLIGLSLLFVVKATTRRQKRSRHAAVIAFLFFGLSDYLEAPTHGQLPLWLWAYKILNAAAILSCRFSYLGWDKFSLRDHYFRFGLGCLAATFLVMGLQYWLYHT